MTQAERVPALLAVTRAAWIPLTIRKKLGRLVAAPPGRAFRLKLFEGTYLGATGTHIDNKLWRFGLHEAATIRLMRRLLRADRAAGRRPVLLDIGTNTGAHLVACGGLCEAALGFEPWAPMRARAEASLAASGFGHVRVMPFGLGERSGIFPFAPPSGDNVGTGSFAGGDGALQLELRRGDEVCAAEGIAPSLVKIDTEGFEMPVLRGLSRVLAAAAPAVVFEVGGSRAERAALVEEVGGLLGPGYRLYGLRRSSERPWLFPLRPGDRCENALAWPLGNGPQPPRAG